MGDHTDFKIYSLNRTQGLLPRATATQIEIVVRDTGVGIPAEALLHVFDLFYRVDTTRSRNSTTPSGGVGVGLPLVQAIIQAHGGVIRVTSQAGTGSTFAIALPLVRNGTPGV